MTKHELQELIEKGDIERAFDLIRFLDAKGVINRQYLLTGIVEDLSIYDQKVTARKLLDEFIETWFLS